jgi:hypothetical protein
MHTSTFAKREAARNAVRELARLGLAPGGAGEFASPTRAALRFGLLTDQP